MSGSKLFFDYMQQQRRFKSINAGLQMDLLYMKLPVEKSLTAGEKERKLGRSFSSYLVCTVSHNEFALFM